MQIQFLGAAGTVTGSCFLITTAQSKILIDCGLYQGSREEEQSNRNAFIFDPSALDAVVLTHAHLDHSGRLPLLVKHGYRNKIYTHQATAEIVDILLKDSAYLNERDVFYENKRREKKNKPLLEPLYTIEEVEATQPYFKGLDYHQSVKITEDVSVQLFDAGHILGSALVQLTVEENGDRKTVVFSGDLGHSGAPVLRDPECLNAADVVVMESTYGDRNHRSWRETFDEFAEVIQCAREDKGNILIPAFSLGRTQDLLYSMKVHYDDWGLDRWNVFLDSPMAISVTKVYSHYQKLYDLEAKQYDKPAEGLFDLPNLHLTQSPEESQGINKITSGAIILAGSGMCNGGRIRHHLKHNVSRKACHLVIAGFQARGTLGRHLVDGVQTIKLWGESYPVKIRLHTIGGFSAHADREALIAWCQCFKNAPKVVLVHGEDQARESLAEALQSNGYKVSVPEKNQTLQF